MAKLTVSDLRKLEKQVLQGEISYSKMVEIINEKFRQEAIDFAKYCFYFANRNNLEQLYEQFKKDQDGSDLL